MIRFNAVFFLSAALAPAVFTSCKQKKPAVVESGADKSIVHITSRQSKSIGIDTVRYGYGQNELTLTGKISFDQDKVAQVFPIAGGNVIKVNVSLGDYVKKGQVLAVLRSGEVNDYQNQYSVASSALLLAKKNLDN